MNDRAYALLREALQALRPVEVLPVEAMLKFHDLAELLRSETRTAVVTPPQIMISTDFKRGIPCS